MDRFIAVTLNYVFLNLRLPLLQRRNKGAYNTPALKSWERINTLL